MKAPLILIFFASLFMFSCAASKHKGASYKSVRFGDESIVDSKNKQEDLKRMILYNATMDIKVKNTDSALVRLKEIAVRHDGYAMNLGSYSATIRVKSAMLNAAIEDIAAIGKVERKNIYGEDVTEQFYDFTIRLENAQKARQRYLELLEKAENVEAALKVEKELERLNGEIDLLQGKINRLKHLEEFSTITVHIQQKKKLGVLGYVSVGLYKGVRWLFVRG